MPRYNRINLDGVAETENRQMAVTTLPGSIAYIDATDKLAKFVTDGKGSGVQLYVLGSDTLQGKRVTDVVAVGDVGIGNYMETGRSFAALVKAATVLKSDTPLAIDATGVLRIGVVGTDFIAAYSKENYTVGASAELVRVRAA
ncbi:Uncharacterised protein [Yersinia aldovae]|uniref:hypothetical protein n=1 Tax=Yersinia aldovae TaxID=29483 RepID=UPI0005E6BA33|nr:hypothetical protein [Yersinia aldovae]CNJ18624.1 Uncharacterised protein [Yersinia aldovae]